MPDPINDTIAALTAAGATDEEITSILKEKFGKQGITTGPNPDVTGITTGPQQPNAWGPGSPLDTANQTQPSEPTTWGEGFRGSLNQLLTKEGINNTLKGFSSRIVPGAVNLAKAAVDPRTYVQSGGPEHQRMLEEATGTRAPTTDYGLGKATELYGTPEQIGEATGNVMMGSVLGAAAPRILPKVPDAMVTTGNFVDRNAGAVASSGLGRFGLGGAVASMNPKAIGIAATPYAVQGAGKALAAGGRLLGGGKAKFMEPPVYPPSTHEMMPRTQTGFAPESTPILDPSIPPPTQWQATAPPKSPQPPRTSTGSPGAAPPGGQGWGERWWEAPPEAAPSPSAPRTSTGSPETAPSAQGWEGRWWEAPPEAPAGPPRTSTGSPEAAQGGQGWGGGRWWESPAEPTPSATAPPRTSTGFGSEPPPVVDPNIPPPTQWQAAAPGPAPPPPSGPPRTSTGFSTEAAPAVTPEPPPGPQGWGRWWEKPPEAPAAAAAPEAPANAPTLRKGTPESRARATMTVDDALDQALKDELKTSPAAAAETPATPAEAPSPMMSQMEDSILIQKAKQTHRPPAKDHPIWKRVQQVRDADGVDGAARQFDIPQKWVEQNTTAGGKLPTNKATQLSERLEQMTREEAIEYYNKANPAKPTPFSSHIKEWLESKGWL